MVTYLDLLIAIVPRQFSSFDDLATRFGFVLGYKCCIMVWGVDLIPIYGLLSTLGGGFLCKEGKIYGLKSSYHKR
jgi:hypothetical protein